MPDLREQIQQCLQGRVCFLGLGNVDCGDDGFGVRLAERLETDGLSDVIIAGTMPERFTGTVTDNNYDYLLFLDAAEFGAAPGSVIFLNAEEMAARFPQISTHKISLGLLAKWIEESGKTRVFLLGVQPESLKTVQDLTPTVQATLEALSGLLCELWNTGKESFVASPHYNLLDGRSTADAPITEVTV
jgi:hydrogenase 3 maturation protease